MTREGIPKRRASMSKTTGGKIMLKTTRGKSMLIQGWERRSREAERS